MTSLRSIFSTGNRLLLIAGLVCIVTVGELQAQESSSSISGLNIINEEVENPEKSILDKNQDNSLKFKSIDPEDLDYENDEDLEDESDSKHFSWKHHQEDHGIYAGRSMMSTDNIEATEEDASTSGNESDNTEEFDPIKTDDFVEKEWQLMFRNIDLMSDGPRSSLLEELEKQTNIFDEIVARLEPKCKRDIRHISQSVRKHKLWALRMVDSIGKLPSGITYGKFSSPGDYEECLSVNIDELVYKANSTSKTIITPPDHYKFHGKYCLLDFRLPLPDRPPNKLLSIHDPVLNLSDTELGRRFPIIQNYSGYASVLYEVGYLHGFCLPSSCDPADIAKSVEKSLEGLYVIVTTQVDCQEKYYDTPPKLRPSQIISIILLTLLFTNAAYASIMHFLYNPKQQSRVSSPKVEKSTANKTNSNDIYNEKRTLKTWFQSKIKFSRDYVDCFSIQKNFERLSKPDPRGLTFVHYTRIVAMGLTVITHTAGMGTLQAITKPADASNSDQMFRDFIPQMLANAFTSIQIFFFMAGFMLVISTFPSIIREKGHLSFVEYAIKRAIRLMPGIAATICLNFLWPLFVDGPMLTYFDRVIVEPCETNWWRTMAFLSNFDHVEKMCLRHSYFSASDYQLHVMAFPLLILLYRQPIVALFLAGLITVAGFVAQVIMILTKIVLPFMMVDYIDKQAFFNVVHYIHHPVWNHMSAFFYGFIIGYLVVKKIRINLCKSTVKLIWIIIIPLGVLSIFAPYYWNHYKRPIYKWQMVLYVLFDRFILLTTCAWLSYASLALSRPPCPKSKRPSPDTIRSNLPKTLTLMSDSKLSKSQLDTVDGLTNSSQHLSNSPSSNNFFAIPAIIEIQADGKQSESGNQLQTASPANLRRQRSSPNFFQDRLSKSGSEFGQQLRPAMSSSDLSTKPDNLNSQLSLNSEKPVEQPSDSSGAITKSEKSKPKPINNVNTLCLILSRLTFQLYLFNMVVLWVDVNHSKYFWFFSYYFIITKALAVYIASSIFAMIFFVTLESPCLTIYIMWVKSRAHARAKRSEAKQNLDKDTVNKRADTPMPTLDNIGRSPAESPQSVGLQMRSELNKSKFTYIDVAASESISKPKT